MVYRSLLAACGILPLLVSLSGCSGRPAEAPVSFPVAQLGDISYSGTQSGPVQLVAGVWQGDPYEPDAASRPEVDLAGVDPLLGDLDGDGTVEALVVLTEQLGGSGIFVYFAVVAQTEDGLRNVATVLAGDRVGVSSLEIVEGVLVANLVVAGPGDPACCPTQRQEVRWRLDGDVLRETSREERGTIEREG